MSERNTHDPFDDELLSAYLDDELSPEERARVEERLQTDPAARQLLDQLRAVSRAVQDLPRETVGENLRAAILERAKAVETDTKAGGVSSAAPAPTSDDLTWPMPQFSAGRTMRGWVWAGLAVAAALLIMVLQPGSQREDDVPGTVAMRGDLDHAQPDRTLESRSRDEVSSAEADRAVASTDRVGGGGLGGAAAESSEPAATTAPTAGTPLATTRAPQGGLDARRRSMAEREVPSSAPASGRESISGADRRNFLADKLEPLAAEPPAAPEEDQLIVVHVRVTPVAFQNKAFDGLLARNGIAVEDAPTADSQPAQREDDALGQSRSLAREENTSSARPSAELDVVLVDAPPAQIFTCMNELDKDTQNYLAVDIEETPPASKDISGKQPPVEQWKQYNRGTVPPQQKLMLAPRDQLAGGGREAKAFDMGVYSGGPESNFSQLRQEIRNYDKLGRAMRVQVDPPSPGTPSLGYRFPATTADASAPAQAEPKTIDMADKPSPEQLARKLAKNTSNVQVLFVIGCEGPPTPSPAAENRAE